MVISRGLNYVGTGTDSVIFEAFGLACLCFYNLSVP